MRMRCVGIMVCIGLWVGGAGAATIGYWTFDDQPPLGGAATTLVSAVHSPALDATGAAAGNGSPPTFDPDRGGEWVLDGADGPRISDHNGASLRFTTNGVERNGGYAYVADNPALTRPASFTLEAFVKGGEDVAWASIIGKNRENGHSATWSLLLDDAGDLCARFDTRPLDAEDGPGYNQLLPTAFNMRNGYWHHVALTYDHATRTAALYGNYKKLGQLTTVHPLVYTDGDIVMGCYAGGNAFDGWLDEVRLTDAVLATNAFLRSQRRPLAATRPAPGIFTPPPPPGRIREAPPFMVAPDLECSLSVSVKDPPFLAMGDGLADDTEAINDALYAIERSGGGVVHIPPGRYRVTDQLLIGNNTTLEMTPRTIIVRDFGVSVPTPSELKWRGATLRQRTRFPSKYNHDITLRGGYFINTGASSQGCTIALYHVKRVRLEDIAIQTVTPGDWAVTVDGDDIMIRGLNIDNGRDLYEDGLHVHGGNNITVSDCIIKSGDDAIALAYGRDSGSIRNVAISGCAVYSHMGMGVKLQRDGATTTIENVTINNIVGLGGFERNGMIGLYGDRKDRQGIRNIHLSNIHLETGTASTVNPDGIIIMDADGITLSNVSAVAPRRAGLRIRNARNIVAANVILAAPQLTAPCVDIEDAENVHIADSLIQYPNQSHAVRLCRVENVQISGNQILGIGTDKAAVSIEAWARGIFVSGNIAARADPATRTTGILVRDGVTLEGLVAAGNEFSRLDTGIKGVNP
ncbi:MAG: right-handed parallel beta-helix repeat-containing protein [Lentisphaerae bacterium]|nr:right-handed parallel beta-helix repeat-containing protein [Lentisphaerota bacterium]